MPALLTLLAILLMPVLEIFVIVQLVGVIGGWWTLAALLATTALGGWIVRREGLRAWGVLQEAVQRGTPPEKELSGTAMVLAGGMLLVAPGFVSDVIGLLFVLPFTRPLVRRLLTAYGARRLRQAEARGSLFPPGAGGAQGGFSPYGAARGGAAQEEPTGRVVQGEVVHEDDDRPTGK
ncbi:FxsA family protein [Actinomadura rugatobispora]|uniref:FxsA family protein n=1 Tax=Actinomadura rugatobispora TaxID=1994 RepID=A0ABW0ZW33_9ACTN|nr:FxsA family protein [Actinomadura rugatobispora]